MYFYQVFPEFKYITFTYLNIYDKNIDISVSNLVYIGCTESRTFVFSKWSSYKRHFKKKI